MIKLLMVLSIVSASCDSLTDAVVKRGGKKPVACADLEGSKLKSCRDALGSVFVCTDLQDDNAKCLPVSAVTDIWTVKPTLEIAP